jgi:hypothetical protein
MTSPACSWLRLGNYLDPQQMAPNAAPLLAKLFRLIRSVTGLAEGESKDLAILPTDKVARLLHHAPLALLRSS